MNSVATMKLQSQTSRVSDWPITAHIGKRKLSGIELVLYVKVDFQK